MSFVSSYSNDLQLLQPEEDLIQINSRPSTPQVHPSNAPGHLSPNRHGGNVGRKRTGSNDYSVEPQVSLLDLDDASIGPRSDGRESNASRSRAGSNASILHDSRETWYRRVRTLSRSRRGSFKQMCDQCEERGDLRDYCNVCDSIFCQDCWKKQISHKKKTLGPGSVPHERTDEQAAKKIKDALDAKPNDSEQEALHKSDEDTIWFGITWDPSEDAEYPFFRDYGRYATIMDGALARSSEYNAQWHVHVGPHDRRYPSLVSFVGQTGAGKSTIIKLVIDLIAEEGNSFPTPVVGNVGADVPTSGDVHLYSDPQSAHSHHPILYADCEGLDGGEREPIGSRFRKKEKIHNGGRIGSFERNVQKVLHTSEREITWANTATRRSRNFAVSHMYPRLLYTFSDVVVFVLKNPRVIENVFEKLVEWAAAALEKSSNQPALPHAIVVLNASENDIDENLWDIQTATRALFASLSRTVFQNVTFKRCAQFWRDRNRQIETVEQLLYSYYASVRVVRVPTRGRPNLIQGQIVKLYSQIKIDCDFARERKAELRMLLDANELQPYLQFAFDHFARDLESPFDFVQASFVNSPIPLDFGGNILKLALNLMEVWENKLDADAIFKELSYMVASCIMLDAARSRIWGTAEQIFPQYLEHVEAALENFCDRHWPCEFVKPGGGARCVNVRSGHGSKGHQLKNGKVFAVGGYVSEFSFDSYRERFVWNVYYRLDELQNALIEGLQNKDGEGEAQLAAEIHKDKVMAHFYKHTANGRAGAFVSHSTCFSCLFEPPEHALPCGHILCTNCLQAYGHFSKNRSCVELDGCPMESLYRPKYGSWRVILKPATAGIRILTLDGGGMRGIVELEALRQIERALGGQLPIQCFFDLIVGTSTGGLIALGLASRNWSVEECTRHFEAVCRKAFTKRILSNIPGVSWLVNSYNHSQYETRPLQDSLIAAYSDSEYLFGGPRPHTLGNALVTCAYADSNPRFDVKVAVTATSTTGDAVVFSNYNRPCKEKLTYQFQRPERASLELKTWEAARATSAAPRIFKPFHHEPSNRVYMDGAMYHNNPIRIADKERKLVWPGLSGEHPDLVLSLGTCYNAAGGKTASSEAPPPRSGLLSYGTSLAKIAFDHVKSSLDSEKAWHSYMNVLSPPSYQRLKYYRLNPQLDGPPPALDQVDSMLSLRDTAREMLSTDGRVSTIASHLVASSFYYEVTNVASERSGNEGILCKGHVQCRLLPDSRETRELGKYLKAKLNETKELHFVIQEQHRGQHAMKVHITPDIVSDMVVRGQFKMKVRVELSNKLANTEILLCLGRGELFPISRFPRSLLEDGQAMPRVRQQTEVNLNRWAGRTPSQQLRRKGWRAPDLANEPRPAKIATYSSREYVIGDSTQNKLRRMATRLINGPSPQPATAIDEVEREAEDMRQRISAAEMDMERKLYAFELHGDDVGPAELSVPEPFPPHFAKTSQLALEPEARPTAFETPQITVNEPWNMQSFPEGVAELDTPYSDEITRQWRDKMYTGQGKMNILTLTKDQDPDGRRILRSSPASTRKPGISGDEEDLTWSSRLE